MQKLITTPLSLDSNMNNKPRYFIVDVIWKMF